MATANLGVHAPSFQPIGSHAAQIIIGLLSRLDGWERRSAIETLIKHLDALDLATEDMEDDDPAGGNSEDVGELEEAFHSYPSYALDQTRGPVEYMTPRDRAEAAHA